VQITIDIHEFKLLDHMQTLYTSSSVSDIAITWNTERKTALALAWNKLSVVFQREIRDLMQHNAQQFVARECSKALKAFVTRQPYYGTKRVVIEDDPQTEYADAPEDNGGSDFAEAMVGQRVRKGRVIALSVGESERDACYAVSLKPDGSVGTYIKLSNIMVRHIPTHTLTLSLSHSLSLIVDRFRYLYYGFLNNH
jgi:hypothetical protein